MAKAKSNKKQINIQFPLAGLNRKGAYRQQPPYTTPDCLNVRAVTGLDGRERGGSRPGLIQPYVETLGGGQPIRLLTSMTLALGDGFSAWSDTFQGTALSASWTQASWATNLPVILQDGLAGVTYAISTADAVADLLPVDTTKDYVVEMFLTQWNDAWNGSYRIYCRLNNTTPDITQDGVMVELVQTGTSGAYTGTLRSVIGGVITDYTIPPGTIGAVVPGWLSVLIASDTISVYWNNVLIISHAVGHQTGWRTGMGLTDSVDGGLALANVYRVQYYSSAPSSALRTMNIASAGGALYRETFYGHWEEVTSSLSLRSDVTVQAVQDGQQLFIADYGDVRANGTDGTVSATYLTASSIADWTTLSIDPASDVVVITNPLGTAVGGTYKISSVTSAHVVLSSDAGSGGCAYRIERAPKIYDPSTNEISIWTAIAGQVPTGCPLICRYLDRVTLAGAEIAPHVWYMSRVSVPTDWDNSPDAEDSQRPMFGTDSPAGVPGDPITALLPHSDDYLVMACLTSLWLMQGDPAYGGSLSNISRAIGSLGGESWCFTPTGELVWLSTDGLYMLLPGAGQYPTPLSRPTLPRELLNIDPNSVIAQLQYDIQAQGIHVFLTSTTANSRNHYFMDWNRKTFWPFSLAQNYEPTATCSIQATAIEDSGVILGGRDGIIRRFSDLSDNDCGSAFSSYVVVGPIALASDSRVGKLIVVNAAMAEGGGDVGWTISPSLTFEGTTNASVSDSGTWGGGLNPSAHPAGRGQAFSMTLTGMGNHWAVEQIDAVIEDAGTRRLP